MLSTNWKGYQILAWAGRALLASAIVMVLIQGQWIAAASLAGFLGVTLIFVKFEDKLHLPSLFDLFFVIAALINAGGWAWDLFNKPGAYDEIAHFYTMFAITLAVGFLLYNELMGGFSGRRLLFVLTIASLGIALGALWEVIEWLADFVTPKQIVSGLTDTITDIILDSAGAILAALLNVRGLNERAKAHEQPGKPQTKAAMAPLPKRS